jgi:anti-anti-sigma factor
MFGVQFSIRELGGHVIVALRGELDIADALAVRTALAATGIAATGIAVATVPATGIAAVGARASEIIVDLEHLDFIDCGGLRALLGAANQLRLAGGDLVLAAPQRHVLRVLAVTGLSSVFAVYASADKAVAGADKAVAGADNAVAGADNAVAGAERLELAVPVRR